MSRRRDRPGGLALRRPGAGVGETRGGCPLTSAREGRLQPEGRRGAKAARGPPVAAGRREGCLASPPSSDLSPHGRREAAAERLAVRRERARRAAAWRVPTAAWLRRRPGARRCAGRASRQQVAAGVVRECRPTAGC